MRFFTLLGSMLICGATAMATVGDLPSDPTTKYITDPVPGATPEVLIKSGFGYLRYDDRLNILPSDGSLTKMLRDGDKLYLSNIFSWASAPGWIEGTVEGDKVTFTFPQIVNEYWVDEGVMTKYTFYAVVCKMKIQNQQADMIPTTEQTLVFNIGADGSLIPEKSPTGEEYFLGNWTHNDRVWEWNLDGDYFTALAPQAMELPSLPSSLDFKPMILAYPHVIYGGEIAHKMEMAVDGDNYYLKGIALGISDLPDAYVKGTKKGNVVSFESNQFLGDSWLFGFTQYFIGGETEYIESAQYGTIPNFMEKDMLEFYVDPTSGNMSSDMSFIIVPSPQEDPENLYYENIYNYPSIFEMQEGDIKSLKAPHVIDYYEDPEYQLNITRFTVSQLSADNRLLDMKKLYFEFLMDGVPFEFTPSIDPSLKKETSLIEFGRNDGYCFYSGEEIVQMVAIPETLPFDELSLRLVYDPASESPIYSSAVNVNYINAIETIESESVESTYYYDLQGRPLLKPSNGMFIRASKMKDGSVKYFKEVIR